MARRGGDTIVGGIVQIFKYDAGEGAWPGVTRDEMEMNVAVLILQKGVIEMVGLKSDGQCLRG